MEERDKFFALAPNQYPQFSDFFRYELLHQRGGWWIDTDVLCRSPTLPSQPIVVGETRRGKLCNAIMRFPAGHPLLAEASAYCRSYQHNLLNSHRTAIGPMLMIDLIKAYPIEVCDKDLFYPIRTKHVWQFGEPKSAGDVNRTVDSSPMVHWFQEYFRAAGLPREMLPPAGSFLADAFTAHGGAHERHISLDDYQAHASRWKNRDQQEEAGTEGAKG